MLEVWRHNLVQGFSGNVNVTKRGFRESSDEGDLISKVVGIDRQLHHIVSSSNSTPSLSMFKSIQQHWHCRDNVWLLLPFYRWNITDFVGLMCKPHNQPHKPNVHSNETPNSPGWCVSLTQKNFVCTSSYPKRTSSLLGCDLTAIKPE